jgi:Ca2+-binding RTX toxin-like protein
MIQLENMVFKKLTTVGTLFSTFFSANDTGTAQSSTEYILYNTTTGALFYDLDGNGKKEAIQIALIGDHPMISAADFMVT